MTDEVVQFRADGPVATITLNRPERPQRDQPRGVSTACCRSRRVNTGYLVAKGIRIFYVERGDGPLVLLCHGFPELAYSWRNQMAPSREYYRNFDRNWELMACPDLQRIEGPCLMISAANDFILHPRTNEDHGGARAQPHEGCHRRLRALDATGTT